MAVITKKWKRLLGSTPLFLFVLSVFLLLVPSNVVNDIKLAGASTFIPVKFISNNISAAFEKMFFTNDTAVIDELRQENEFLRSEVRRLASENDDLIRRLQSISIFKEALQPSSYIPIFADIIISSDATNLRKSCVIGRGALDDIEVGMPVVWQNHLVGKVSAVGLLTSQVLLLTDRSYKVSVFLEPQYLDKQNTVAKKRLIGVVEGRGADQCELKWVSEENKVGDGWFAVTAGDEEGGLPRGLIVGKVDLENETKIKVIPLSKFRNLDFVMVLKKKM